MKFKRLGLLLLSLAIASGADMLAKPLTPSQALARLNTNEKSRLASAPTTVDLAYTKTLGEEPLVYVFANPDGYMVVSGDDCAPALLGFGDTNFFDTSCAPLMEWLDDYALQIDAARKNPSDKIVGRIPRQNMKNVKPLLTTLWNQGSPYNQDCPKVGTAATYTGCVATAMAQVMKYHNWPPRGKGSRSYDWESTEGTKTLSMDFSTQVFNWANMTDTYSSSSTTAQKNAVAQLMHACGISVDMGYGTGSSGAQSTKVSAALINYFDYSKETIQLQRAYIKRALWEDYVYKSLTEYGPVYYTGRNYSGGHAFVCDGYLDGYWHINWGWGGSSNGYFLLTAMDPSSQGIGGSSAGYNQSQTITAFTKPMYEGSKRKVIMGFNKPIVPTYTALTRKLKFEGFFFNMCPDTIRIGLGMHLTSPSGKEIEAGTSEGQLLQSYGYTSYTIQLPQLTENGIYKVQPMYYDRDQSEVKWEKMYGGPGIADYVELAVNNGTVKVQDATTLNLKASDLTLNSPFYRTQKFCVTASISNPNSYEVMKEIYGSLWSKNGDNYTLVSYGDPQTVTLDGDQSQYVDYISGFSTNTPAVGTYYFAMAVMNGENLEPISDFKEVTVGNNTDAVYLSATGFEVENSSSVDVSKPIKMHATIRDTNGIYANYFDIFLFPPGISSSSIYFRTPFVSLKYGESKDLSFEGKFGYTDYKKGDACSVYLYYYRSTARVQLARATFTVGNVETGVSEVNADDDEVKVCIYPDRALISSPSTISNVEIFSMAGERCNVPILYADTEATADITTLVAGVYVMRLQNAQGMHTLKLIIK